MSELVTQSSTREQDRWQQATFDTDSGDEAVHVKTPSFPVIPQQHTNKRQVPTGYEAASSPQEPNFTSNIQTKDR